MSMEAAIPPSDQMRDRIKSKTAEGIANFSRLTVDLSGCRSRNVTNSVLSRTAWQAVRMLMPSSNISNVLAACRCPASTVTSCKASELETRAVRPSYGEIVSFFLFGSTGGTGRSSFLLANNRG